MAIVWHAGLPQEMFLRSSLSMAANVVQFETASGPGKTRARSTIGMRTMNVPIVLTGAQMIIFEEFFEVDLTFGAEPFEWFDPLSGDNKEFRFTPNTPPQFNVIVGGTTPKWQGIMSLDILRDGTP